MQRLKGAWALLLIAPFHVHADVIEGSLSFRGLVTETTCAFGQSKVDSMLSFDTVGRASLLTLSLEGCSEQILVGTKLSLREVISDTQPPRFMFPSGERLKQGDDVDTLRFNNGVVGQKTLSLMVSRPVDGVPTTYGALFHLTYD
ncbi:hypothetical protein [Aeromonas salmonicida]|uniref:hypothetical protein n=1 Tax=Aeromonas salmonicida TaxID=645 RepID=UPI003D08C679